MVKGEKIRFIILMGVSGSGKTAVGKALAARLGWAFFDGDNYHPPENVSKMGSGVPLEDSDRAPWLDALHDLIAACLAAGKPGILASSALKEVYRQRLLRDKPGVQIVYLKGSYDLILERMQSRKRHYMKPEMLQSQFDSLEEPQDVWVVDISPSVDEIVSEIEELLSRTGSNASG